MRNTQGPPCRQPTLLHKAPYWLFEALASFLKHLSKRDCHIFGVVRLTLCLSDRYFVKRAIKLIQELWPTKYSLVEAPLAAIWANNYIDSNRKCNYYSSGMWLSVSCGHASLDIGDS